MMTTAQQLLDEIDAARQELITLYHSLPITALEMPELSNGWSVKDMLAHIAAWESQGGQLLNLALEDDAPLLETVDVDAINEQLYQERRDWTWEEVEAEFQAAHRAIRRAIQALSPARLASEAVQAKIRGETIEHYAEHLPDLRRWHQRWQERRR